MTIQEIHNIISTWFTLDGNVSFIHSPNSQVNTWPIEDDTRTFPLAVLDPIGYSARMGDVGLSKTYRAKMAFLNKLAPDHTHVQQLAVVTAMEAHAMRFIQGLNDNEYDAGNFDTAVITGVRIDPVFYYKFSGDIVAGVILSFDIQALDTYDYCG